MSLAPGTPFVVFGDDFGRHVSTLQQVFVRITARYPVIWVNGIGHRTPRLTGRDLRRALGKLGAMIRSDAPATTASWTSARPSAVVAPRVLPWHRWPGVHRLNTASLLRSVRGTLDRLELSRPPVLVTGSPPSAGVVGRLGEAASIYFCMDDFTVFGGVDQEMLTHFEHRLLERVDAVVATANTLVASKRPATGRCHLLPQGVDYDHFAAAHPAPTRVQSLPHPRLVYSGRVRDACDLDLLATLADAFPDGSVIMVGATDVDLSGPLSRSNVHHLGPQPYQDLPGILQACDAGLIPYRVNAETASVNPLKLLEYLAAGLPVISTDLPEVQRFPHPVVCAGSPDAFVAAARQAISASSDETADAARRLARGHSWDDRANRLLAIVADLVEARTE